MIRRCGSRPWLPQSQCDGELLPTSPNCRARLSSAMPPRNSCEKPAMIDSETPRAFKPGAVKATFNAVRGTGFPATAVVTGALLSQAFAAATSLIFTSEYDALVM